MHLHTTNTLTQRQYTYTHKDTYIHNYTQTQHTYTNKTHLHKHTTHTHIETYTSHIHNKYTHIAHTQHVHEHIHIRKHARIQTQTFTRFLTPCLVPHCPSFYHTSPPVAQHTLYLFGGKFPNCKCLKRDTSQANYYNICTHPIQSSSITKLGRAMSTPMRRYSYSTELDIAVSYTVAEMRETQNREGSTIRRGDAISHTTRRRRRDIRPGTNRLDDLKGGGGAPTGSLSLTISNNIYHCAGRLTELDGGLS